MMKQFLILIFCGMLAASCSVKNSSTETIQAKDNFSRNLSDFEKDALKMANEQLTAYNNRDIEAFLAAYSDSVKVYTFPGKLNYTGKEHMRKIYTNLFEKYTKLDCSIVSEIVHGNKVVHEESVVFDNAEKPVHAVCVYVVEDGKITEAHFL